LGEVAPLSHHSKPGLTLKISDWKSWIYTDGTCHIQKGKSVIEAGVYHPSSGNYNLVEPNGSGITNTIIMMLITIIMMIGTSDRESRTGSYIL